MPCDRRVRWIMSVASIIAVLSLAGVDAAKDNPCDIAMEVMCGQQQQQQGDDQGSGMGMPSLACDCGTGSWVRTIPHVVCLPALPIAEVNVPHSTNGTYWLTTREATAQPGYAEVHVSGSGASHFWRAGSVTRSAVARYSSTSREQWQGTGIPCPRLVTLAASGGGGLTLTLTCSAHPGCGASGTSSISGSCSSLGDASASIDNKRVDGSVAYESSSNSTEIEGQFGAFIDDSSASVDGRISRSASWSVEGAGNVSGAASYTVKDDRTYCAFTNRPITRISVGVALCASGATVDDNGSAAFDARAFVSLTVN